MDKLIPDNRYLNEVAGSVEGFIEQLQEEVALLKDENADIFSRFMAYNRCQALRKITKPLADVIGVAMAAGFNISHEIFQTPTAIECGWDEPHPEINHFFINENQNEDGSMNDLAKEKIAKRLVESLLGFNKNNEI